MSGDAADRRADGLDPPAATRPAASIATSVALLDRDGVIVWVNDTWEQFCRANGGDLSRCGVGVSYLAVCDAAAEDERARQAAEAIRAAVAGDLPTPLSMPIPCGSPVEPRWFDQLVSSRVDDEGRCIGATVTVSEVAAVPAQDRGPAADALSNMTFPDGPRVALERALDELTARAREMLRAQTRLRALLQANAVVAGDLSLRMVLRHIVEVARELVGARYAALGVVASDGSLEQFLHVGMDEQTVARIGAPPRGRGILGLLVRKADPVRLADLRTHPAAAGFPPHHPPMTSFLGVPIRVRGQVFGNIYLTESANGQFSAEDEQLITALAGTAGVAIENARLYEDSERRRRWQAVSTEVTQRLFSATDGNPMEVVLRYATQGADGDFALLGLPVGTENVRITATFGELAGRRAGQIVHLDESVAEPVLRSGKAVLVQDYGAQGAAPPDLAAQIGSIVAAPLMNSEQVVAALAVGRLQGRRPFDETDLEQLTGYAGHAGIALELDRARADRERLVLLQQQDRIADDLHDQVVQELFATGMGLQSLVHALDRVEHQNRVLGFVDNLDATIRRIRTTIYQLHQAEHGGGLQRRLLAVLDEEAAALGFRAGIEFSGPLDIAVPPPLADDVVAVVREAVSNTARHAAASAITIGVSLHDDVLTVDVIDDGRGIGAPSRSSGLSSMRRRAQRYGGSLDVSTPSGGGCRLRWTAYPGR